MMKGMKSLALVLALSATASALTSCSSDGYSYPDAHWQDGLIVTVGGKAYEYKEIYDLMEGERSSAEALYNTASDIVAQLATPITSSMEVDVEGQISDLEEEWRTNADTNGTSYREEMENALDEQGVDDMDELRAKLLSEAQIEENSSSFYNDQAGTYGETDDGLYHISEEMTKRYVEEERPYHISHILVQVDASDASSDATAYYDGHISSDNASKISQVVRQLSSSSSFGSVAQVLSDDAAANYGELGGDTSSAANAVGMSLSTSYVNEFKLGVYAYDTFLNPNLSEEAKSQLKKDARVPSDDVQSDITSTSALESTEIGQGKAFGIPLSVALTMGQVADQTRADSGASVAYTDETQYPRNILFNNYFNNHAVSFIYDDSDTYAADFLASIQAYDSTILTLEGDTETSVQVKYPDRYQEYLRVQRQLDNIVADKYIEVDGLQLVSYQTEYSGTTASTAIRDLPANQKVLSDGKGNPIIVARAGTGSSSGDEGSTGYQGIHFITVNHDPYSDMANDYEYWRVNIPASGENVSAADSTDYGTNPSYVNFVNSDPGNNSSYQTRIDNIKAAVAGFDSNVSYAIFEHNIETVAENLNLPGSSIDEWGAALFSNATDDYWTPIADFIRYNRDNSQTSDEQTLDEGWKSYLNMLNLQEDIAPARVVPTVCISYFQGGSYGDNGEMEAMCHVER